MKKNISILLVISLLVVALTPVLGFASSVTRIVENVFTGEGYITHADQEQDGLSFNMFHESNGLTYVRVSGPDANVTNWKNRTNGRFVSDSEMDSIMNPQPEPVVEPIAEESTPVVEPIAEEHTPVIEEAVVTPTPTNSPSTPITFESVPTQTIIIVEKIVENVFTGEGYITHADQEQDGLSFNMFYESNDLTYVRVSGPDKNVTNWKNRTNGRFVSDSEMDSIMNPQPEPVVELIVEGDILIEEELVVEEELVKEIVTIDEAQIDYIDARIFTEIGDPIERNIENSPSSIYVEGSKGSIRIGWGDVKNLNGFVGYNLFRTIKGGTDWKLLNDFPMMVNGFTDMNVEIGEEYDYYVSGIYITGGQPYEIASATKIMSGKIKAKNKVEIKVNDSNMKANGKSKKIDDGDTAPIIVRGRTMVPIRVIVEELGGNVEWIGKEKKVIIELNNNIVELVIDKSDFTVNGETKEFDVNPMINNGRTLIPLRFVTENLGVELDWEPVTQSITLFN
jgi:hypothetical protein